MTGNPTTRRGAYAITVKPGARRCDEAPDDGFFCPGAEPSTGDRGVAVHVLRRPESRFVTTMVVKGWFAGIHRSR
jgi:hypothetical protein